LQRRSNGLSAGVRIAGITQRRIRTLARCQRCQYRIASAAIGFCRRLRQLCRLLGSRLRGSGHVATILQGITEGIRIAGITQRCVCTLARCQCRQYRIATAAIGFCRRLRQLGHLLVSRLRGGGNVAAILQRIAEGFGKIRRIANHFV